MQEGSQIGQYALVRKIGEGGMAEVWEARHIVLGNRVAVKFLLPEFARNQDLQERFLNEAKRQALLQHPNIVPAIDFFQVDGRSFFVMQYVDGQSLDDRLKKSNLPLSLHEIHSIAWDVLSALDYAHSQDIVHRDIKPANMLMDHSGRVLLMDFGIAKALREERSMTVTGTSMGTPDYMSPEQILEPKRVNARSDIYSFGCVLYAMLAGSPPFGSEATSQFVVQERHVRAVPPPLVFCNPEVPAQVSEVVFKCLEKSPSARYESCGAVMNALNEALTAKSDRQTDTAAPESPPSSMSKASGTMIEFDRQASRGHTQGTSPTRIETVGAQEPARDRTSITPTNQPTLQDTSIASGRGRTGLRSLVTGGAVAILVIGCLAIWLTHRTDPRVTLLEAKDFSHAPYNDSDYTDCRKVQACLNRAAQATALLHQNWNTIPFNSPYFQDCMNYQPCEERKARAGQLAAVTDWRHAAKNLLADCMGYQPCEQAKSAPVRSQSTQSTGSGDADLPACCNGDARCLAAKKKEQIPDCAYPSDSK